MPFADNYNWFTILFWGYVYISALKRSRSVCQSNYNLALQVLRTIPSNDSDATQLPNPDGTKKKTVSEAVDPCVAWQLFLQSRCPSGSYDWRIVDDLSTSGGSKQDGVQVVWKLLTHNNHNSLGWFVTYKSYNLSRLSERNQTKQDSIVSKYLFDEPY